MKLLTSFACVFLTIPAAADESGLIRVTSNGATRVFQPDGIRVETAEQAPNKPVTPGGQLSPDGMRRAYVNSAGDEALFFADADGRNARRITPDNVAAGHFSWSPDGKSIALLARPSAPPGAFQAALWQIHTIDADGKNLRRLAAGPEGAGLPKFAPDGRLAYLRYYPRVGKLQPADLVLGLDDEPQVVVKNTYINDYAWSPDSKTIAYSTLGALGFVEVATGKQQLVAFSDIDPKLNSHAAFYLTFSSDGKSVVCTISFLGGRRQGGPKIFGDDEVFILPRNGKPTWFRPGVPVQQLEWLSQYKSATKLGP